MKFDDEQLDELLRDIDVPDSLAQSLREIPELHKTDVVSSHELSKGLGWIPMLAIAASLLLLMSLAISSFDDATGDHGAIASNKSVEKNGGNVDASNDIDFEMELLKSKLQSIDLVLMRRKTKRMQQKLAELKRSQLPILSSSEQQSIVLSMSCQAAIEMGADLETVRDELEEVKLQYPDSQGAAIANRLLQEQGFLN